jgi:hypothetical protein
MTQHTKESLLKLVSAYGDVRILATTTRADRDDVLEARATLESALDEVFAERDAIKADAERYRFARLTDDLAVCEWFSLDTNTEEKAWWAIDEERIDLLMKETK